MPLRQVDRNGSRRVPLRWAKASAVAVAALLVISVLCAGCLGQGEGERCTYFPGSDPSVNGTDECQNGLVCYPSQTFPSTTGDYDRCCPPVLSQSTVPACQTSTGCPTCGQDASTDASQDGKADAPMDARHDGKDSAADGKADGKKDTGGGGDAPAETSADAPDGG